MRLAFQSNSHDYLNLNNYSQGLSLHKTNYELMESLTNNLVNFELIILCPYGNWTIINAGSLDFV